MRGVWLLANLPPSLRRFGSQLRLRSDTQNVLLFPTLPILPRADTAAAGTGVGSGTGPSLLQRHLPGRLQSSRVEEFAGRGIYFRQKELSTPEVTVLLA